MITTEFKHKIREAVITANENYTGSDAAFSRTLGIHKSVFNRIKNGELEKTLAESKWLTLARMYNVSPKESNWKIAKTSVYIEMEDQFRFCQKYSKAMMLIDDCGIGKTECAKHLIKGMKNSFYIDCSQAKTKQLFIRTLAKTIGVDNTQKYADVILDIKYHLNQLETPFIVLDEFGDLDYYAMLEYKELWNGTQGQCGWFAIGAEGLRRKMERGMTSKKIGFRELFRRFSEEFIQYSPVGREDRQLWYRQLYTSVAEVNVNDKNTVKGIVSKCLAQIRKGNDMNPKRDKKRDLERDRFDANYIPSLSYIETLIQLENDKAA